MNQTDMTSKNQNSRHWRSCKFLLLSLAEAVLATAVATAATSSLPQLHLSLSGSIGSLTPELTWDAQPGAVYTIQSKTNLAPEAPWLAVEPVVVSSNLARWKAPELNASSDSARFYRLLTPTPAIFRIEPAVGPTSGGTTLYVIGQCLGTNGQARIGGLVIPPHVLQPGSTYSFTLPTLPEGAYDVDWLEGGQVVATASKLFSVTAEVQPSGITQRLLEPPVEPPASPGRRTYSAGKFAIELDGIVAGARDRIRRSKSNVSNNRTIGGNDCDDNDPLIAAAMEVKEKGNRTKCAALIGGDDCDDGGPEISGRMIAPAALKVKEKGNRTKCTSNLGVSASGELEFTELDMQIPGRGLDFILARTYHSRTTARPGMTYNWTLSYDVSVSPTVDGMAVFDGTGRRDVYYPGTNGIYSREELFNEGRLSNDVFTLTFSDTGHWEFNPLDSSPAAGKLARSVDRDGNTMLFHYDVTGRLAEIVDDLNRTNTLQYNAIGLLSAITDFSGRVVRYEYEVNGNLSACVSPPVIGTPNGNDFPGGKTNRYAYSSGSKDERLNHNLTAMTDPMGSTWLQVVYLADTDPASIGFDTVDYLQRGSYRIKYRRFPQNPSPANSFAVVKCIENDADGNVAEYYFDSQNRCVRQLEFTGRANPDQPTTETDNRPVNKLRDSDPDYYETRCEWNPDSLCTRVTYPEGNSTVMIYERAFNQNSSRSNNRRRSDGDLRVLRELACCLGADTDGDGVPDITERTWRFVYDQRFGSPTRAIYDGGQTKGTASSGRLLPTVNKRTIAEEAPIGNLVRKLPGRTSYQPITLEQDFVTAAIDPRGNQSTVTYDSNGRAKKYRRVLLQQGRLLADSDQPVVEFDYNSYGQCTAVTNAADGSGYRRVDLAEYYDSGAQAGYLHTFTVDIQGPTLIRYSYEYDARGNRTRFIDPRTNDWLYTYNSLDQCNRSQSSFLGISSSSSRITTQFTYDANDNLVRIDHENRDYTGVLDVQQPSWTTQFQYDQLSRMTACWQDKGKLVLRCTSAVYDGNNNLVLFRSGEATNDPHNVVQYLYDERDLLYRTVHGPGSSQPYTEQYDYTLNGWKHHDIQGLDAPTLEFATTTYDYDGFDRLVRATDPMGNVDQCAYDANGNLVFRRFDGETNDVSGSAGNMRLSEIRCTYDGLDRLVTRRAAFFTPSTQSPIGDGASVSTCTYAPNSELLTETDDNGHITRYSYDTACRLSTVSDPKTNRTAYAYDNNGNVLSVTETDHSDLGGADQVFVTTLTYDAVDRCASSTDNAGNSEQWSYDSRGNLVRHLDANGNLTGWVYDGLNRVTLAIADLNRDRLLDVAVDAKRAYNWNDNDCLLSTTDSNTNTTSYTFDSLNRLVMAVSPSGTHHTFVWDARSDLVSSTDPNGTVVTCTYDLNHRCARKSIKAGSGVMASTTFELSQYDGLGRLVLVSNDVSMLTFNYDSLGNRVSHKQDCLDVARTFDGVGNCLSMTYPGGSIVQYAYDAADCPTNVNSLPCAGCASRRVASYAYDSPGRIGRISGGNNVNTRITYNGYVSPPNTAGDFGWQQVSAMNHQIAFGGAVVDRRSFFYDRNQNNKLRAQTVPYVQGQPTSTNFWSYDSLDRLNTSEFYRTFSAVSRVTYNLDGQGNRLTVASNLVPPEVYTRLATTPPSDFQMDRYSLTPFASQFYDQNGNLAAKIGSDGVTSYFFYDYADRLIEVDRLGSDGMPHAVASFTYDVLGDRISKTTVVASGPGLPPAPITTRFVYDGGNIIEERDATGQNVLGTTICFPDCAAKGEPKIICHYNLSTGLTYYQQEDEFNSALALTDGNGAVLERYEYDDFGFPTFLTSDGAVVVGSDGLPVTASPLGNPFLFRGMFWDGETALYLDRRWDNDPYSEDLQRIYDPGTGRYISSKGNPVYCWGGNAYSFAGDNPWSGRRGISSLMGGSHDRESSVPSVSELMRFQWGVGRGISSPMGGSRDRESSAPSVSEVIGFQYGIGRGISSPMGGSADREASSPSISEITVTKGGSPARMKTGTVKFFNESKGFGMAVWGSTPGDLSGSSYKEKPKPTTRPHELTGHVTLIK